MEKITIPFNKKTCRNYSKVNKTLWKKITGVSAGPDTWIWENVVYIFPLLSKGIEKQI